MYGMRSSLNRHPSLSRPEFQWPQHGCPYYLFPTHSAIFLLLNSHEPTPVSEERRSSRSYLFSPGTWIQRHRLRAIQCIRFGFLVLTLAFPVTSCPAEPAAPRRESHSFTQVKTERVVIGSVADISSRSENNRRITIVHMLEFRTDVFLKEPTLLQVRLCGDQISRLELAVHTDVMLVYDLASHSKLTGCLRLISSEPWQDDSTQRPVTLNPSTVKWSIRLEKSIQSIVNDSLAK